MLDTEYPRCEGCLGDPVSFGNDLVERPGVNPDCANNRRKRTDSGLSTEACGLILAQYSIDLSSEAVIGGGYVTTGHRQVLSRIDVMPVEGIAGIYDAASSGGTHPTVIDLEHEVEFPQPLQM